jgi:hypothetical protein
MVAIRSVAVDAEMLSSEIKEEDDSKGAVPGRC